MDLYASATLGKKSFFKKPEEGFICAVSNFGPQGKSITIQGTAKSGLFDDTFNPAMKGFFFQPDIEGDLILEKLMNVEVDEDTVDTSNLKFKPLNEKIVIKVKQTPKGTFAIPVKSGSLVDVCDGEEIEVSFMPSFYFNLVKNEYGVSLKPRQITFTNPIEAVEKPKARSVKRVKA